MKLFQRLFFAAVLSGLAAGAAMSAVQQWRAVPLIIEAETYEVAEAAPAHSHEATDASTPAVADAHHHDEDEWAPEDGLERTGLTVLANLLAGIGFAFLLAAVPVVTGLPITAQNGIVWGLCGFLAFHLVPAFGLPPELPGMPAADVAARQVWWWGTALATAAACYTIARYRNWPAIAVAAVLLVAPHVIGAPQAPHEPSAVPAHLAAAFAASALTASAVFWLIVGPLYGWLFNRFATARAGALKGVPA